METVSYRESLITVAKLYYLGDIPQNEIAQMMGLSRSKVSRMLKTAREMNIVRFDISSPPSHFLMLGEKIKNLFSLKEVIVVPSCSTRDGSKANVGQAAAEYVAANMHDNCVLGITWGSTVSTILRYLPTLSYSGCSVWQLTAGLPAETLEMDGHELTKKFARKLNADWHVINAPFIVQNALLHRLLMEEPEIKNHFSAFKNMDIAIVGLGSSTPESSATFRSNYITLEESRKLVAMGCAADLCGHRLFIDCLPADTFLSERVISVDLEDLKNIPNVVAVAAGEDKATSAIAAARGGYIKTLIIDEIAAIAIGNVISQ